MPVETARALQMSTAVNVMTALTDRLPNKEDKLSVLVSVDQLLLERMLYSFVYSYKCCAQSKMEQLSPF